MGAIVSTAGHLCVDLSHVEMSGDQQQALVHAVQATVVAHLAKLASHYKVVTITLGPNNGQRPIPEEEPTRPEPPGEPGPPSTPPGQAPPRHPER